MALINNFPITINNSGGSGSSVPSGGTIGQALVKRSATDGDVEWGNIIPASEKGTSSGVAELDSNGKVPSSQLPSYVDDVIEGYYNSTDDRFYEESTFTTLITPESSKSWVDISSNKSYRWSGSVYIRVDEGVQLGETSSTAYRGDRGKTAYDFSQTPYTSTPAMNGTGSAGSSSAWAKGDHVHPKDTTKTDKVSGATSGHLAALDSSGNLTDSGKALSDLQAKLTAGENISISGSTISATFPIAINQFDKSNLYSTSEKMIGQWTNGKPIYQKTFTFGALTNTTSKVELRKSIGSSVDKLIRAFGYAGFSEGEGYVSIPEAMQDGYPNGQPQYIGVGAWTNAASANQNTVFLIYNGQLSWVTESYVTIQYTKTTDSALSVTYGDTNDYSTTEQIVGTWIDGSPLYQKTVSCGALPNATTKNVAHGISNLSHVINIFGWTESTSLGIKSPLPYVAPGSINNLNVCVNIQGSNIFIQDEGDLSSFTTTYVTIQYTKTS